MPTAITNERPSNLTVFLVCQSSVKVSGGEEEQKMRVSEGLYASCSHAGTLVSTFQQWYQDLPNIIQPEDGERGTVEDLRDI
jgi:hypothetical protein